MFSIFKRRNIELDALKVKMMEDGVYKDIMASKVNTLIDDVILLKYIERNVNENIEAVKWYLDLMYPVSNRVVKYVLNNRILDLIPNVYTSYCDNKIRKMKLSEEEYRELVKKFKGYDHIPSKIIEGLILEIRQNLTHRDCTLEYVADMVCSELLSDPHTCDQAYKTISSMVNITEAHYDTYIKAKGSNISIFNITGISLDRFHKYCTSNDNIDLSLLNKDIIAEFVELYRSTTDSKDIIKLRQCVESIILSSVYNIEYIPDDIFEDNHRIIYSDSCNIESLDYIDSKYITYGVLYKFLNNGGLLVDIPNKSKYLLDLNLYKTSLIGTIENMEYIDNDTKDKLYNDPLVVDTLLRDSSFMVKDNMKIIMKLFSSLTILHTIYYVFEHYPLLFKVYKPSSLGIGDIQRLILSNPEIIQYVPEYLVTNRALDYCIDHGHIQLTELKHCKLDTFDIFKLVRYNLQDLLILDGKTLSSVMSLYGDRIQTRLGDVI